MKTIRKTFLQFAFAAGALFFLSLFSCNKTENDHVFIESSEVFLIGLNVKDVKPLDNKLHYHALKMIEGIGFPNIKSVVSESIIIEYENFPLKAILTPLLTEESYDDVNHLFFEKDGLVSNFSLLLTSDPLCENMRKYSFLTLEGSEVFRFVLEESTGLVSNFAIGEIYDGKGWLSRFNNCLKYTMSQLIEEPAVGLICMAFGKICAPSIAGICFVAATEGYFEEPGQP
jgi:hypothetical protein